MEDRYRTIESLTEGIYKEKGSKFISFAYPVESEEEIKDILSGIREKYYDARHRCYAYMLGADKKLFRTNDDGEPSSTAGKPILGQILSNDITNVLIVVVRYFGGTKLGVSGLINAYKVAAADAIQNSKIVEKTVDTVFNIRFDYYVMNDIMRIIKEEEPSVLNREFDNECRMSLSIRNKNAEKLRERLCNVDSLLLEEL